MPNDGPAHHLTSGTQEKKLFFVLCLTILIMVVEVFGGYVSGSLALLADAGHMFTDVAALALSWAAVRLSRREPDSQRTFGYQRLKILAAYTNGVLLFFLCGIISVEAVDRITKPQEVDADLMFTISLIGLITNALSYLVLRKDSSDHFKDLHGSLGHNHEHGHGHEQHGHDKHDLNIQSATVHVLSDLLGSFGAVIAAVVIMATGWTYADPILSFVVCTLIFTYAVSLLRKTTNILIEAAPDTGLPQKISATITKNIKGVKDVHHIHVWSLTEHQVLATMDVTVEEHVDGQDAMCAIRKLLHDELKLSHVTIQVEKGPCPDFDL
jgi:cobalt-zinc-cadmium efflux system protein